VTRWPGAPAAAAGAQKIAMLLFSRTFVQLTAAKLHQTGALMVQRDIITADQHYYIEAQHRYPKHNSTLGEEFDCVHIIYLI
jgi:hypothetical protein